MSADNNLTMKKRIIILIITSLIVGSILISAWIYLSEKWFVVILLSMAGISIVTEAIIQSRSNKN
jgi:hypothetical protein